MELGVAGSLLTALGLSIPAGLNAYIPLLAVALSQQFGWLELRPPRARGAVHTMAAVSARTTAVLSSS